MDVERGPRGKNLCLFLQRFLKKFSPVAVSKPPGYCNWVSNEGSKLSNINFSNFCLWNNKTTFLPNFPINWETNKDCMSKDWPKDTRTCRLEIYFTSNIHFMGWKIKCRRAILCFNLIDLTNNFYINIYINIDTYTGWFFGLVRPKKGSDYIVNPINKVLSVRIFSGSGTFMADH